MSEKKLLPVEDVILWTNGMVMVFDTMGEQRNDLQGPFGEVVNKVLDAYEGLWALMQWEPRRELARFFPSRVPERSVPE